MNATITEGRAKGMTDSEITEAVGKLYAAPMGCVERRSMARLMAEYDARYGPDAGRGLMDAQDTASDAAYFMGFGVAAREIARQS